MESGGGQKPTPKISSSGEGESDMSLFLLIQAMTLLLGIAWGFCVGTENWQALHYSVIGALVGLGVTIILRKCKGWK